MLRVKEIKMSDCLLTHALVVDWCCGGTKSGHNTGFQTMFRALVATQKHIALACREHRQCSAAHLLSSIPPFCLHSPKENMVFPMISGSATPCFLTWCQVSLKNPPVYLDLKPMKKTSESTTPVITSTLTM